MKLDSSEKRTQNYYLSTLTVGLFLLCCCGVFDMSFVFVWRVENGRVTVLRRKGDGNCDGFVELSPSGLDGDDGADVSSLAPKLLSQIIVNRLHAKTNLDFF